MASDAQIIGYELLKTGTLVSFRIVEEEVLSAPDEAEFGLRLQLKFVPDREDEEQDEDNASGGHRRVGRVRIHIRCRRVVVRGRKTPECVRSRLSREGRVQACRLYRGPALRARRAAITI